MLFPVRGGPSSSPGEPQAAACSMSRGALRVMTKCKRIKIQKSNILLQPGTTVYFSTFLPTDGNVQTNDPRIR